MGEKRKQVLTCDRPGCGVSDEAELGDPSLGVWGRVVLAMQCGLPSGIGDEAAPGARRGSWVCQACVLELRGWWFIKRRSTDAA